MRSTRPPAIERSSTGRLSVAPGPCRSTSTSSRQQAGHEPGGSGVGALVEGDGTGGGETKPVVDCRSDEPEVRLTVDRRDHEGLARREFDCLWARREVLAGEWDVDALTSPGVAHGAGADDIAGHHPQLEHRRGVVEMDRHRTQAGGGYLDLDLGATLKDHLSGGGAK